MNKELTTADLKSLSCNGGDLNINVGTENYSVLVDFHSLNNSDTEFFNASEIVKQYNINNPANQKRLNKWTNSKRFKEIIEIWETQKGVPKNKIYFKKRDGSFYHVWIHKDLFLSLMIWLDAKYELAITDLIEQVSTQHFQVQQTREHGKIARNTYTSTLQVLDNEANISRALAGKPPLTEEKTYFSHGTKLMNKALFDKQINRNDLDEPQLELLEQMEARVDKRFTAQITGRLIDDLEYHSLYKELKVIVLDEVSKITAGAEND